MPTRAARRVPPPSLGRVEETEPVERPDANDSNNNNTSGGTATGWKGSGGNRLPSIKERRPAQKKSRASSFNEGSTDNRTVQRQDSNPTTSTANNNNTTTTIAANNNNTTTNNNNNNNDITAPSRRASVPQGNAPQTTVTRRASKPSFAGIGKRVSNMVRAGLAFQGRKGRGSVTDIDTNHMEVIHELPRSPRFTTFMSAEAQYAMMKGYEDKLYEQIATSHPEFRPVLQRNKTPFHNHVSFIDPEGEEEGGKEGQGRGSKNASSPDEGFVSPGGKFVTSLPPSGHSTPAATRISSFTPTSDVSKSPDQRSFSPESGTSSVSSSVALPSPFLRPLRRQSLDVASNASQSHQRDGEGGGAGWALHRTSSLPSLPAPGPSSNKRLVLTYRLESAMDILDTMKRRNKENSLSPRVFRITRQVDAVRDFNSWTKVWNKEFKVGKAK